MTKQTGGPAFPFSVMTYEPSHPDSPRYTTTWHEGMTLRDYFAAALVSSGTVFKSSVPVNTPELVAAQAYQLADAMLEARK